MSDSLSVELSKVLFKHEPNLLACEAKAIGRATGEVAALLGCILANVIVKQGGPTYLATLKTAMDLVNDSAIKTAKLALAEAENAPAGGH